MFVLICFLVVGVVRCYFFFFQAEDGIRDYKVTGVQTCALPISTCCPITTGPVHGGTSFPCCSSGCCPGRRASPRRSQERGELRLLRASRSTALDRKSVV